MKLSVDGATHEVSIEGESVVVDGRRFDVSVEGEGRRRTVRIGGHAYTVELPESPVPSSRVLVDAKPYEVGTTRLGPIRPPAARHHHMATAQGAITARMVGRVLRVNVGAGDLVEENDLLLVLEAMKMENEIRAPYAGRIQDVLVSPGQRVTEGETMLILE